ncbi:MAG: hypothetical protein M1828_004869 [Chrysothrix sp. TS-e1954]|nr:MAG: hypothetical protein M1828_004869 [Chrysothrix sp. TS-e1954]
MSDSSLSPVPSSFESSSSPGKPTSSHETVSEPVAPLAVRATDGHEIQEPAAADADYVAHCLQTPCKTLASFADRARALRALGLLDEEPKPMPQLADSRETLAMIRRKRHIDQKQQHGIKRKGQREDLTNAMGNHPEDSESGKVRQKSLSKGLQTKHALSAEERAHKRQVRHALSVDHRRRRKLTAPVRNVFPIPRYVLENTGSHSMGFYNPGNMCYRRSVLSALFHAPIFVHRILDAEVVASRRRTGAEKLLIERLRACAAYYWGASQDQAKINSSIRELDRHCRQFKTSDENAFLANNSQEDAHSYLLWLLDQLTLIVPKGSRRVLLSGIFKTRTQSPWTCEDCGEATPGNKEDQSTLSIGLKGSGQSIQSLLQHHFQSETLEIRCESDQCKQRFTPAEASKNRVRHTAITCAPEVLIVQIKRFETDYSGDNPVSRKSHMPVTIDEHINLAPFTRGDVKAKEKGLQYTLAANLSHRGSLTFGHYVTWARSPDGKVRSLDDQHVKVTPEHELCEPGGTWTPYVLVYTCDRRLPDQL